MKNIHTDNLTAGYEKVPLIENISISVIPGKIVTLIGPNGAGKSTILKTIAGFLSPVAGVVYLDDADLNSISGKDRADRLSVMLTSKHVAEYATCMEVVSIGRYQYTGIMGRLTKEDEEAIDEALMLVGAVELKEREYNKLSDGQKQRVLLARALVQKPSYLILDEPTSYLDIGYKLEFVSLLKKLAEEKNVGIIMSLHEIELAALASDEIICVDNNNNIARIGSPDEILTRDYISKLFDIKESVTSSKYLATNFYSQGKAPLKMQSQPCEILDSKAHNKFSNTKIIMVQGTMSNAGKSLIVAGLCRIFKQDGYKVAPFKSQNMALNSYVTKEGLEMGRAQVMQAEAAGVDPSVYMNPILLKPTSDVGSQVIVNGVPIGNMRAREYFEYKKSLVPHIETALSELCKLNDIIVIEGAGSPAEINLKQNDIVNMGMAKLADCQVLLVGDVDRGGVFAQLFGTVALLEADERARIGGLIINKFRGDKTILDPGIEEIEVKTSIPVVGVVPYMDVLLEDEDSLTERFNNKSGGLIDIAVIRLPHISNFTDFYVFDQVSQVSVRYIDNAIDFKEPDMIIIPGSKNTVADMKWLKSTGLADIICEYAKKDKPVFGICGGYQMLGERIEDPNGIEEGGSIEGLNLLDCVTVIEEEKIRTQVTGTFGNVTGIFASLSGLEYEGYEIHMGRTDSSGEVEAFTGSGTGICAHNVYGTYIHGIFDKSEIVQTIVKCLAGANNQNVDVSGVSDYKAFKESQYDKLADILREHVDIKRIYELME